MLKSRNGPLWARQNDGILFLLALLIFATGIVYAGYVFLAVKKQADYQEMNSNAALVSPRGRMLVILLDSARKDFMFSDYMPFLDSLRERGAWGISEVVSIPLSVAGDHAIFSGTVANMLSIFEDFKGSASDANNLFKRVTDQDKRAVILSSHCLRGAYGKYTDLTAFKPRHFSFSQYREDASYLFEQAYRFLKNEKWDLAVVQFITLDYIGHLETPLSPNYISTLKLIDDYMRQLVDLTTDQDVVLITSEHGMDDHGFHVDRTPIVIETPFILWGPQAKKGGPKKVLQIDWAPTLSILAGVSPFYDSPALPSLDLLKLSAEDNSILLRKFSRVIPGTSTSLSLNELREKRLANMGRNVSPLVSVFVVLTTLLSMALFSYVALFDGGDGRNIRSIVMLIGVGMLGLYLLVGIVLYWRILDHVSYHLPFSANFILSHPLKVAIAFALMAILPMLYLRIFGKKSSKIGEVLLLFLFAFVFAGIFLSANSYHPLNWAVLSIPLVAWGINRRPGWVVIFIAIWIGLAIRRLTFYNAYTPFNLPDRWLIASAVLTIGFIYLWWRLPASHRKMRTLVLGILCCIPSVIVIAWPFNVEIRAVLLLLAFFPVVLVSKMDKNARDVLLALGVTLYYLGTSSNINHTTHIVAFPILIAIWSIARGTSTVARGVMVSMVIWVFYLMPGNFFDLKLIELTDRFILSSARTEHIEFTVMVIASRYILPAAILIWGMKWTVSRISMFSMASTTLLPIVFGIGATLTMMISIPAVVYPWEQLVRLTVLLGYFVALICAFLIVAAFSQVGKLFRLRTPKATT